ncbi:hypothetical protein SAMN04488123_11629 [Natribacillus halophilus]|uniref:Uncharacterized protein n=1 Tax=Natribacillus halophilus TaxID=549003 RepID=A0A1G8R9I1_9BACI|nr:hypothetical protein SAMN04488123_11629 [Natribacillus halophilus]
MWAKTLVRKLQKRLGGGAKIVVAELNEETGSKVSNELRASGIPHGMDHSPPSDL